MPKITKSKVSGMVIDDEANTTPITDEETSTEGVEENNISPVEDNSNVEINADVIQKAPVKFVRILPKKDHTCVIGGERYFLKSGVCQNVPLEVKNILTKADLLSPL